MATDGIPPAHLRKLAQWLDQPLTPGREKELNAWLAADPDNQIRWDRWLSFNAAAKRLQVVPSDVTEEWGRLRDDLHLGRSTKSKSMSGGRSKKIAFFKRPLVIALASMLAYGLFLMILYAIRTGAGF